MNDNLSDFPNFFPNNLTDSKIDFDEIKLPAMPFVKKQQLNITASAPPKQKSDAQRRKEFWGDSRGNQLLNR